MSNTIRKQSGGSFRFDWKEIGVRDETSRRSIRRIARQLAAPPNRQRRSYGRAKLLTVDQIERVIDYLRETSRVPESDVLKVYLSFYAGLRACEIARLTLDDVTTASGKVGNRIYVSDSIAKGGYGRVIGMHDNIAEAIEDFRKAYPDAKRLAISSRSGRTQSPNAMAAWFWHLYRRLGYHGCSSHSGRRWHITELARIAYKHGCSLVEVQKLAGHARLDSTQAYIDPISDNLFAMVASLGGDEVPEHPEAIATWAKARQIKKRIDAERAVASRRAAR